MFIYNFTIDIIKPNQPVCPLLSSCSRPAFPGGKQGQSWI